MNRFIITGLLAASVAWAGETQLQLTSEIIDVLKSHYVDKDKLDQKSLNDATVEGILSHLGAGAKLLTADEAASNVVPTVTSTADLREPLARVEIIDPAIGYIRIGDVTDGTAVDLDGELKKFAEQKATGYILDLRFADGTNFAAAAAVASRFLPAGEDLFLLKQATGKPQVFRTTEAPRSLASELADAPLMLLVNAQTRGSAEVLTGALRAQDRGIVIGGPTAGSAVSWEDVKLSDGRVLRLATAKIAFPKGSDVFPGGIVPDIMVKIDSKTEREVVFNVQSNITLTASLLPHTKKKGYSEADLVKAFRGESIEGLSLRAGQQTGSKTNGLTLDGTSLTDTNAAAAAGDEEGEINKVRDVVLQRAVDILKGIRVLQAWQ
jgi:C-terminal processing protease CtpA/Prc